MALKRNAPSVTLESRGGNTKNMSKRKKVVLGALAGAGLTVAGMFVGNKVLEARMDARARQIYWARPSVEAAVKKQGLVRDTAHWAQVCRIMQWNPFREASKIGSIESIASKARVSAGDVIYTVWSHRSDKPGELDRIISRLRDMDAGRDTLPKREHERQRAIVTILVGVAQKPGLRASILQAQYAKNKITGENNTALMKALIGKD